MADILFRLLIGHLFGDYLLQNNWMALNKKNHIGPLIVHCLLYTVAVVVWVPELLRNPIGPLAIFISHIVPDGTSLVDKYLKTMGGRDWDSTLDLIKRSGCNSIEGINPIHQSMFISYTAIVQTVADNTIHLALMYAVIKLIIFV